MCLLVTLNYPKMDVKAVQADFMFRRLYHEGLKIAAQWRT